MPRDCADFSYLCHFLSHLSKAALLVNVHLFVYFSFISFIKFAALSFSKLMLSQNE